MKSEIAGLETLFSPERRYLVPLFQKPYAWNENDHWAPLWNDIVFQANHINPKTHGAAKPHFLGTLVLNSLRTPIGEVSSYGIIDGQHRLSTLQLALAAFRDLIKDLEPHIYSQVLWPYPESK